ncbi:MAG: UDP-N-acetylglucosamine 2-epimerase [Dehalococcoidales bacterium]
MAKTLKRKIGVVTGARAEYGYLKPLMKKIVAHPRLELLLYVTGLHLVKEYGNTIQEIIKDGFNITKTVDMDTKVDSSLYDMSVSIGKGVIGFADALKEDKPDIFVVFGDRVEALAAAVAVAPINIPVAHISGGEIGMGDIDDNIRHAITKLAHLHFTATKQSKERVLKLGEEPWRVFQVGALSLDAILNEKLLTKQELHKKYNLVDKPVILVCYHPTTTEWQEAEKQMETIMEALVEIAPRNMEIAVIYPNAYPGGKQIIDVIKKYSRKFESIHIFESLPHLDYISLMSNSSVFVGNSSSGIIEAPSLKLPYVSIGTRQQGREKADNVVEVGYNKDEIKAGIQKSLFDKRFLKSVSKGESPYGDGKASDRIVKVLSEIEIDQKLLQKKMTY